MKTIYITILSLVLFLCSQITFAQSYQQIMGKTMKEMYNTQDKAQLLTLAQTFDRIGMVEKNQWIPYYYASYACASTLFYDRELSEDEKDEYLDQAQAYLDKAREVEEEESEILALQTLVYQLRIFSASRGMLYSGKANASIAQGLQQNENNPRLYYLKAMNLYNTPKAYGGGAKKALPYFEKAEELFEQERAEATLLPRWGAEQNKQGLAKCKEQR